jgi:YVTN family beta-propeller protein
MLALAVGLLALPALADWQTATVGAGNTIWNVAIDPARNRTFTTNYSSGTVTVVDGRANAVQTWTVGIEPQYLAVNPITGKLYVSINGSATNDTVVVLDTLGATINKLPVKRNPVSLVIDANNDRLYVANYDSDTISIYQGDIFLRDVAVKDRPRIMVFNPVMDFVYVAYEVSDSITALTLAGTSNAQIYTGHRAYDVAVCASVNAAYVVNTEEDSVAVIDCNYNSVSKKILVGDYPVVIVADPAAKQAYVTNFYGGTVTAINCENNTVYSEVLVKTNPWRMAINPITRKLYVGNNSAIPVLMILDWRNGVVRDSVVLAHSAGPFAVNPVTNKIYVSMEAGNPDSLAVIDGSDFDTTITVAKSGTQFTAVNPISGDAFFSNSNSDNVTVIKANGDTLTIAVGDDPRMIAVNPLTNKAFVCNTGSKSVSVISGSSYSVERTIIVDTLPTIVAVNPLTNFIYVNSFLASANRVKVIDGKDWDTTSVPVGSKPFSIAVNPATNRIYVGNDVSNTVTVIDGAHHTVITSIPSNRPYKMDVNPVTNKIYVASLQTSGIVKVIDGATNGTTNVTIGNWPSGVAVNRANNKIYVTNYNDSTVTEIDGVTNGTSTIKVGVHPEWIAADPVTGKVFVSNSDGSSLSIIDCASRSVKTMAVPAGPRQVAVNPVTGKVYLACYTAGRAVVVDQTVEQNTNVVCTEPNPVPWDKMIPAGTQNRGGYTYNRWSGTKTKPLNAYFSLATSQSFWKCAANMSTTDSSILWATQNYLWEADSAFYGENIYRRFGLETQGAATNNLGVGTPFTGNILNSVLYRIDYAAPTVAWWDSLADDNDSLDGYGPYTVKAVITDFSGLDTVYLHYNPAKAYTGMTRALADTFVGVIPAQAVAFGDTAALSYFIEAQDHAYNPNGTFNYSATSQRVIHLRNLTGVAGNPSDPALPKTFALQAAYPNPSRGQTVIKYQLPKASNVQLQVYNVAGQLVKTVNEGQKPAGYHQIGLKGNAMANGIYFYQLKAGEFIATRKLIMIK